MRACFAFPANADPFLKAEMATRRLAKHSPAFFSTSFLARHKCLCPPRLLESFKARGRIDSRLRVRALGGGVSGWASNDRECAHVPVLMEEVSAAFSGGNVSVFVDGTLGAGGHSLRIFRDHAELDTLIGIDQDEGALRSAEAMLREQVAADGRHVNVVTRHANFRDIEGVLVDNGVYGSVCGILMDIGVSSMQLDTAERGFSFRQDGPLDMRMDKEGRLTARDIVNEWPEHEIACVLRDYGEERNWRSIARRIVDARHTRPLETTRDLVEAMALRSREKSGVHPATRVFQALRIAVNDELGVLAEAIPRAIGALRPGGRLAIITFHSLEDRVVKRAFLEAAGRAPVPPGLALLEENAAAAPLVRIVTRKPVAPQPAEVKSNPRSRSAKLRVVEKLDS